MPYTPGPQDMLTDHGAEVCRITGSQDGRYGCYLAEERGLPKSGARRRAYDRAYRSGAKSPIRC